MYILILIVLGTISAGACPQGMIPCEDTSCAPPGGACPKSTCKDGTGRSVDCSVFKVVHYQSMLMNSAAGDPGSQPQQQQQQQQEGPNQQQQRQEQHQKEHIINQPMYTGDKPAPATSRHAQHPHSSLNSRATKLVLPEAVRRASSVAARKLQQLGGALDALMLGGMGDLLGMSNTYSSPGYGNLGGIPSLLGAATGMTGFPGINMASTNGMNGLSSLSGLSGLSNNAARAYNPQAYQTYQAAADVRRNPTGLENGISSGPAYTTNTFQQMPGSGTQGPSNLYNTINGMGNTAWGTATNVGVLAGGKLDAVGYAMTAKASKLNGDMTALDDAQLAQQYGQTGSNLAYAVAPHINNVHSIAQGMTQTLAPMGEQAINDKAGLAVQASEAFPSAVHSMAGGAVGVINTVSPYLQGRNDMLTRTANIVQQGAAATQQVMHGTAVPLAQGGLAAMSNIGDHLQNGFAEGFPEGYNAAMDRRAPYQQGPSVQQQFEQQPALYLPQSYAPLGAMANITYPCPTGRQNSIAPVGTIIGPGIPCGVPLLMVPKAAVPTNRMAPAVVNPVPVAVPPPPAPSPSPIPIPVTPLPPPPSGGGNGTTLPPVVPPIVGPPTPGGGNPPIVPPIIGPGSPSPGGGTPIPTTPPTTTPGSGTPIPTTPPTGLVPPNVGPVGASPAPTTAPGVPPSSLRSAANYMAYSGSRMRGSNSVLAQQQAIERQQLETATGDQGGPDSNNSAPEGLTASLLTQMRQLLHN